MWRKREQKPEEKKIPVAWIEAYAEDNGPEIQDVLECMVEAWQEEQNKKKKN